MAYSWFLKLALNCIHHLAWPLLALGYPLCASVQAIETDSYSETRDLISYWILFSLIYLFEYAFLRPLSWFQFWPYIKLMIIFWLIMPDFGRSSYVYNKLIRTCIWIKPQAVISKLKNWRKLFAKKENFLLHAERYIQENGTEALEKLIASKITTHNPGTEATNTISAADKKETQQTNGKRLETEHKDITNSKVIEKKEISAGKQDIPVMPNLSPSHNIPLVTIETNGIARKDATGGEIHQSSTHKEVQKEWTCAVCQVTTTCEKNLNSHLLGKKHKATCEALKAKHQAVPQKVKNDQSKEELKQKNIISQLSNIQILRANEHAQTSREPEKSMYNVPVKQSNIKGQDHKSKNGESIANNGLKGEVVTSYVKEQGLQKNLVKPVVMSKSKLRCEVCNVNVLSEVDLACHLNGKKHLAQIQICAVAEKHILVK